MTWAFVGHRVELMKNFDEGAPMSNRDAAGVGGTATATATATAASNLDNAMITDSTLSAAGVGKFDYEDEVGGGGIGSVDSCASGRSGSGRGSNTTVGAHSEFHILIMMRRQVGNG
jgi:hypothetical protein